MENLQLDPAEVDALAVGDGPVERGLGAGGLAQPRPGLLVVADPVLVVPAVALGGDPLPGLDQGTVERVRAQRQVGPQGAQLAVAAVVVDVGMGDDHVGQPADPDPELVEGRGDRVGDRTRDPGVHQQRAVVAGHDPLLQQPRAELGVDPVDPLGDLVAGSWAAHPCQALSRGRRRRLGERGAGVAGGRAV